jgi:cell division septation protein DedD
LGAAPETPPAPALAANEMVVQVFSSADLAQARGIVDKLKKAGYQAFLSPVQVGAQTLQRVRIGPFTDRTTAQRVADEIKKRFRLDTWITR